MNGTLPRQTAAIFERLSKGQFISEDSQDDSVKMLYDIIYDEDNYDLLHEYFLHIGFCLEKGGGYYYFSRIEKNVDLERKIAQAYKWIDVLDFLKTYGKSVDRPFAQGTIFSPHQIFEEFKVNHALSEKLDSLRRYPQFKAEKPFDRINSIIKALIKETFVEIHNEFTTEYKVLAAFGYLERLVMSINISDDEYETIPE
jgi:hypothetical protein